MRLTRVHVAAPLATGVSLALPDGSARHLTRVLRLEAGDHLLVFNGEGGEYEATIETLRRDSVTLRIGERREVQRESPLSITLLQGIARGEKMDLILQKATELGIRRIVPLTMVRSTVRLDVESAQRKQTHWQGVVVGAAEQSGRDRVPLVQAPQSLANAVAASSAALKLLLSPDADSRSLPELLAEHPGLAGDSAGVCLLVGPEGGFDPAEIISARGAGFVTCRLGPRVLRTETAALVALAVLQFGAGDLTA